MREYSNSEIGMLMGTVIGGCLSVAAFLKTGNVYAYTILVLSIVLGISIGRAFDCRTCKKVRKF